MKFDKAIARNVLAIPFFCGLGMFVYGAWLLCHPVGWMLAGLVIAVPSVLVAWDLREK